MILLKLFLTILFTCENKIVTIIQKIGEKYKTKVMVGRFFMLRYSKNFRDWNTDILTFLSKFKL